MLAVGALLAAGVPSASYAQDRDSLSSADSPDDALDPSSAEDAPPAVPEGQRDALLGPPVVFADPTVAFAGRNLCVGIATAINGLVYVQSPGDDPMVGAPRPGIDAPLGISQQSVHPNKIGTTLYAEVMQTALKGVYR
ncbi:hypothetical protein [Rathayibacter sp. VKM Ac-2857]|uniref:hypothetical protein n=1 Tax=Rathayibacter sp. VKM Ac-2857 TaxID=2739020 RepID=UPI001565929B|nr:hypothetical protein [Rathayibacter sp. VKM Ac-2857]NQX15055.1 hypothetical protein [Rathayibacter sp. VKM Ac-2857]